MPTICESASKSAAIECAICFNETEDGPDEYVAVIGCGESLDASET